MLQAAGAEAEAAVWTCILPGQQSKIPGTPVARHSRILDILACKDG